MTQDAGVGSRGRAPAALFLTGLYRSAPVGSLVEVRFRTVYGMGRRFHEVERLGRVVESVLELASRTDVYVGVLPRRRRGGGRADLVQAASVVWVDCDTSSSVAALRKFRPAPGMIVASGSGQNCHAYWLLEESVELDVIERVNRRLALTLRSGRARARLFRISPWVESTVAHPHLPVWECGEISRHTGVSLGGGKGRAARRPPRRRGLHPNLSGRSGPMRTNAIRALVVIGLVLVILACAALAFAAGSSPSFTFSTDESGATFQCSLDGATPAACSSPHSYSGLHAGQHTVTITSSFTVPATPPSTTTAPSISGTAQAGQTLTADPGTWSGDPAPTFSYQWSDGNVGKSDTLPTSDVGKTITVTVTATNSGGSATATSASVGPVTAAPANSIGQCGQSVPGVTAAFGQNSYTRVGWDTFTKDQPPGSSWSNGNDTTPVYTGDQGMGWTTYPDGWGANGVNPAYQPSTVLSVHDGVFDFYLHNDLGSSPSPEPSGNRYETYGAWSLCEKVVPDAGSPNGLGDFKQAILLWPQNDSNGPAAESDFPEGNFNATSMGAFAHYGSGGQDSFSTGAPGPVPVACVHGDVGSGLPLLLRGQQVDRHQHKQRVVAAGALAATASARPGSHRGRKPRSRVHQLGVDRLARPQRQRRRQWG